MSPRVLLTKGFPELSAPQNLYPKSLVGNTVLCLETMLVHFILRKALMDYGVSWPSGLAYRTQVLVLAAECGFESRP